jgi:hypothetical protein
VTWIKSTLQRPDGRPLEGVCVTAILMIRPGWSADRHGQIVGEVTTRTDQLGQWRMNLLPYNSFDPDLADYVYYQVDETTGALWKIRVPPVDDPASELWMRDVLIDTVPSTSPWRPIARLGDLFDVDLTGVDQAAPGSPLVYLGNGSWGIGPP